jgi:hypothetical protein
VATINELAVPPAGTGCAINDKPDEDHHARRDPLLLALTACGSSPAAPSRRCRRYPLHYTENGVPGNCEFAPGRATLDCYAGSTHGSWQYASLSDFVSEAQVPNLVLVQQRTWSGGGPMLISYGSHTTVNTYEGPRLLTRVRTASNAFASWTIDSVRYDHWDRFGRPTAGLITRGETTDTLTLHYDDGAGTVHLSNGEFTLRDKNGNVAQEAEFGGSPHVFVIQELAEVCE